MGIWNLQAQQLSKAPVTVFTDTFETFSGWTGIGGGTLAQSSAQVYDGSFSAIRQTNAGAAGATKLMSLTVGRSFVIEYYGFQTSGALRVGIVNSSGNGYGANFGSTSMIADRYDAYTGTLLTNASSSSYTRESNIWYKVVMISRPDNTFIIYGINPVTNEVLAETVSVADTTHAGPFDRVFITGGIPNYYDNIKVKRFES